jgi:hypothetical protein
MLYPRPVDLSRRRKRRARSPCGGGAGLTWLHFAVSSAHTAGLRALAADPAARLFLRYDFLPGSLKAA